MWQEPQEMLINLRSGTGISPKGRIPLKPPLGQEENSTLNILDSINQKVIETNPRSYAFPDEINRELFLKVLIKSIAYQFQDI